MQQEKILAFVNYANDMQILYNSDKFFCKDTPNNYIYLNILIINLLNYVKQLPHNINILEFAKIPYQP